MGGLAKKDAGHGGGLHRSAPCRWRACLPLAGFWAKDEVLADDCQSSEPVVVLVLVLVSVVIYRALHDAAGAAVFTGEPRNVKRLRARARARPGDEVADRAAGRADGRRRLRRLRRVGRLMGFPGGFGRVRLQRASGEVFQVNARVMVSSIVLVLVGIAGGFYFWGGAAERARRRWARQLPQVYRLLRNKFYIDDLYQAAINRVVLVVAGVGRLVRPRGGERHGRERHGRRDALRRLPAEVP